MALTLQQIQADDGAYAESVKQNPPTADVAPQTHADIVDQIQQAPGAAKKVGLFQQFGNIAGRVTTNVLDSVVSAADSMYDSEPMKKARDVVAGGLTAAANTGDAFKSAAENGPGAPFVQMAGGPGVVNPIWDHAKGALMDFRDAVAVKDPTLADNLVQGVGQLALPFAGYSRALGGVHTLAETLGAGVLTDATALAPHDARLADLFSLGKQTEGKFGDVLRTLSPDGSALNAYMNYLGDRGNESEAEGRFKNVLDGFGANLIATPLLHTVGMVLKQGTAGLRYAMENGVASHGDLMPANQEGKIGWDPQARTDMSLSPEERARVREGVASQRATEEGITPEVEPEPIPPNAAVREGVAKQRDLVDPNDPSKGWTSTGGGTDAQASPLEKDPALSHARTFMQGQLEAGESGSLHAMATSLGKHIDGSTPDGAFYKDLLTRISAKNLDTKIVPPGTGTIPTGDEIGPGTAGVYSRTTNGISLYDKAFESNERMVHVFTHEAVHAATVKSIVSEPGVSDSLQNIIDHVQANTRGTLAEKSYGFTNPKELVAEAESNPKFQEILKNVPDGKGTAWDTYKKVIGGIFGLSGAAIMSPQFDKVLTKEKEGA